jgi:superfamily II DNA/RNA helicase
MSSINSDLTFITNDENSSLKERFQTLIKDTAFFDCLVGYFYTTGFHLLYKSLERTEKIRILIGIGTGRETIELINQTRSEEENSSDEISFKEASETFIENVKQEMENSEDKKEVEEGVQKFIEWIKTKKLEIRAYPSHNLHAKLYIMTFREEDRDVGRVITGSSNFTRAGLKDNLEFNVELKNRADYQFAKQKFEELWNKSVDVTKKYIQTVEEKTWLNQNITPYELYLKFLYEYFKDELTRTEKLFLKYLPENFKEFEYQQQAILNAKTILEAYGGVFISDVVGLGKTYVAAMLAGQLDGRTMVIAPPSLLNENNPGSWRNVFADFHIPAEFISIGKLDDAKKEIQKREYKNIIIDESHRFRNETTISYVDIAEICRGKRVILVSATPYNNRPEDLLNQIKLFQNPKKSTIPGISDLDNFFKGLQKKLEVIDRQNNYDEYLRTTQSIAREIREKVLKYIMVRRTRQEIEKYFSEDLKKNNIKFPEVEDPKPLYYQLNELEDEIFEKTINLITKKFTYSRYTPLLYLKKGINQLEEQSQRNMKGFMKVLLVKRLESSFYAFRNSVDRFIDSYKRFIQEFEKGNVYVSKKYINKIFDLLEREDDAAIEALIEAGKAERYNADEFQENFIIDLRNDLQILNEIKSMWASITRDPKLETLIDRLQNDELLKTGKLIIFTESKETAEYLFKNINKRFGEISLLFHGNSSERERDKIIENFDARAKNKKDDYRILVTTDVLSEGVNLHRSNIVINYDIPWNPTRLMQRVGRVNRIDTSFDKVYTFNFFPTKQSDNEIELTNIARSKIEAFLNLLGGDASILTEGEPVTSHELFDRLISRKSLIQDDGDEETELKYLKIIEDIRNNNPELFEKIKQLPKKARSSRYYNQSLIKPASPDSLLTFFKKDKLMKFFISTQNKTFELDFLGAAKILECYENEQKAKISLEKYYELLDKNKTSFFNATYEEIINQPSKRGIDSANKLLKILKATQQNSKQLTEDQEEYLKKLIESLESGSIPKKVIQQTLRALNYLGDNIINPLEVIKVLQTKIPQTFLKAHFVEITESPQAKREVILSLYLAGEGT